MASVINSFVIEGINASVVKIETSTLFGQPTVQIVGLGDAAVKEAKERLESAITHEKFDFPIKLTLFAKTPGGHEQIVNEK